MRFHVLAALGCCLSPQAKSANRINTMIRDGLPTNNEYPFATLGGLEPATSSVGASAARRVMELRLERRNKQ